MLIYFSSNLCAQTPLDSINMQLRTLFGNLSRPTPSFNFNWDMSAHAIDSNYFVMKNTIDTITPYLFGTMYDEMRTSAYDTTLLATQDTIEKRARYSGQDTLNMMIMNYKFYRFHPDALTTNIYFDFDTINNILTDKVSRPGYPYLKNEVFIACPAYSSFVSGQMMFRISPQNIFKDGNSTLKPAFGDTLKINFGDGNGWHIINPANTTYLSVNYATAGEKIIQVKIVNDASILAYSVSKLKIKATREPQDIPEEIRDEPGMTVGVYHPSPCGNNVRPKVLIYLEGIDVLDMIPVTNRDVEEIYESQIRFTGIGDLRNFGYNIFVVDWKNSRIDMKKNADNLIEFINKLKCEFASENNDEEFVIIGESMGGVIANFALTKMETDPSANNDCAKGKMHNTRLLITMDSPHKGAHIPMSLQLLYEKIVSILPSKYIKKGPGLSVMMGNATLDFFDIMLNSTAAKQMLREHYETESLFTPYTYGMHDARKSFLDDLQNIGLQPKFCKTIAMSNGSLNADQQTKYWDGAPRVPNDIMFKFKNVTSIKILGNVIPLAGWNVELRTNPNNVNAPLDRIEFGTYWFKIKIRLFKLKLYWGPNSILAIYREGELNPTSTSAGSVMDFNSRTVATVASLVGLPYSGTNGIWAGSPSSFLWNTGSSQTTLQSDGFHWCFIPTASALNWNAKLNIPFQTMSLGTIINSMKYDVSIGLPRINNNNTLFCESPISSPIWLNCLINNQDHLFIRQDRLPDINNNVQFYDYSCQPIFPNTIKLLNREIGDNILNLENRNLPYSVAYSAIDAINVNVRNPHYAYTTVGSTNQLLAGIYSKSNPFNNAGAPATVFDVNNANCNYLPPYTGTFAVNNANWTTCCQDFLHKKEKVLPTAKVLQVDNCIIYPNPATTSITLQFKAQIDGNSVITIYNSSGVLINTFQFAVQKNYAQFYKTISLPPNAPMGLYIVKLKNGNQIFTNKLKIN